MHLITGLSRLFSGSFEALNVASRTGSTREAPMQLDDDLLLSDDLPPEAKTVLDEADKAILQVRRKSEEKVEAIRAECDQHIAKLRGKAETETALVHAEAARELSPMLRDLFLQLKAMQTSFMKDGQLDAALAVRNRLRAMRSDLFGVKTDPGNMTDYGSSDYGKSYLYEIVGSNDGNCWGTDFYTGDSRVAVAAVHAGAVRIGERALVRVAISDGSELVFDGCERYGIRSLDYGNYSLAFSVERV